MDVEVADVYKKFVITKKKHYIGVPQDGSKEPIIKGMEGIKSDRPTWINNIERQFADDIKCGKDPTTKIREEYKRIEFNQVPLEDLEIKLTLAKNPEEYSANRLQRRVGYELNGKQGDTIKYYKSNAKGGGSSSPNLLSSKKYLEMLKATVKDSLKLLGYDYDSDIAGQQRIKI